MPPSPLTPSRKTALLLVLPPSHSLTHSLNCAFSLTPSLPHSPTHPVENGKLKTASHALTHTHTHSHTHTLLSLTSIALFRSLTPALSLRPHSSLHLFEKLAGPNFQTSESAGLPGCMNAVCALNALCGGAYNFGKVPMVPPLPHSRNLIGSELHRPMKTTHCRQCSDFIGPF